MRFLSGMYWLEGDELRLPAGLYTARGEIMNSMNCELALKVDVNTLNGYLKGVPRLLDIFAKKGIRASFFFSMGPDNSGKAIRRMFRKGTLTKMAKMLRAGCGLKPLLYGTLLKAPMIAASDPDIIKRAVGEGHDCGVRCWDHVLWRDCLSKLTKDEIRAELSKAAELFSDITGSPPGGCAAPDWQVSPDSLAVQGELGFAYASDVRGVSPFLPSMEGACAFPFSRTIQIPTTLPTLDELCDAGMKAENVKDHYLDLLEPGLNVCTIHADMEGGYMSGIFSNLVDSCVDGEMTFPTLRDAATRFGGSAAVCGVKMAEMPGRINKAAVQME